MTFKIQLFIIKLMTITNMKNQCKIGYQGAKYSYSEFATTKFIAKMGYKNVQTYPLTSSNNVAKSLLEKTIDFGVVAVKNNIGGLVNESKKILSNKKFQALQTLEMNISHCLFTYDKENANKIDLIVSHEQALKQCKNFIKNNFPTCKIQKYADTAKSAEDLKNGILTQTSAVICSESAGLANNLFLFKRNIADMPSKTTFTLLKLSCNSPERCDRKPKNRG